MRTQAICLAALVLCAIPAVLNAQELRWEEWSDVSLPVGNEYDGFQNSVPARRRLADTSPFGDFMTVPQLAKGPAGGQLILSFCGGQPQRPCLSISSDGGETWESVFHTGEKDEGMIYTFTGYGNGVYTMNDATRRSTDGCRTWQDVALPPQTRFPYVVGWAPYLVFPDGQHAIGTGYNCRNYTYPEGKAVPMLRESFDAGATWSDWRGIPEFPDVSEVALCLNAKGEVVAALRSETVFCRPDDHSSRLEYSVSGDGGKTWAPPKVLQGSGRHHPSMVLLPDGRMVMTYVVRLGYAKASNGDFRYGIEAVVSYDGGHTWDTDNRYVLTEYQHSCLVKDADGQPMQLAHFYAAPQETSTIYLPEEQCLLTVYGTAERVSRYNGSDGLPRGIGMVKWMPLAEKPVLTRAQPGPVLTDEEAAAALDDFGKVRWSIFYLPSVMGMPDGAWCDAFPPNVASLVDGNHFLRLDYRQSNGGFYNYVSAHPLESNADKIYLEMGLRFPDLPDPKGKPICLSFYCQLGSGPRKFPVQLQFTPAGTLSTSIAGPLSLGVKPDQEFLFQLRADRKQRRVQIWIDGKLLCDKAIDEDNVVPGEAPAMCYFGYGTRSNGGVADVASVKLGFLE